MIIERRPHNSLAHRFSASPGLKANGGASAAQHSGRSPKVTDKLDLSRVRSRRTVKLAALAGLALAGAVTGHATNVTPSAVIADLTGSERLDNLRLLDQFGDLEQGSPEAAYRAMGVSIGEIRYYNYTRLELESGHELFLGDHDAVADLAGYFKGEHSWGLSEEEMRMAAEISQIDGLSPSYYGETLDPEGISLGRSLSANSRGMHFTLKRERYQVSSAEDLRKMHDFFLGDTFSPEERSQVWAVRLYANYDDDNLIQVFDGFEAGETKSFYTTVEGVNYRAEISSRQELLEFGQRILNQRHSELFQPFPEEVAEAARVPMLVLSGEFDRAEAQLEVLRGMNGVDLEELEQRLERLEQARSALEQLQTEIAEWEGGDSETLRHAVTLLNRQLDGLSYNSASWSPIGSERLALIKAEAEPLFQVISLTSKPQAPQDWTRPPRLEGRYETVEGRPARPKLYGPRACAGQPKPGSN